MAFDREKLSGNTGVGSNAPSLFTYGSGDSTTDVQVSGYFDDALNTIRDGDFVMVLGSDGAINLRITETNGVLTTTAFL